MVIEQRIDRVNQIGQKHRVGACNMLLNNNVEERVYELVHSPLPVWMEDVNHSYCSIRSGSVVINLSNHLKITVYEEILNATFSAEEAINDPNLTHLTLQCTCNPGFFYSVLLCIVEKELYIVLGHIQTLRLYGYLLKIN